MKICHICPSFNNVIYQNLVKMLFLRGIDNKVFYFTSKKKEYEISSYDYLTYVKPYNNIDRIFFYYKEYKILKEYLKNFGNEYFDFTHAHTLFSSGMISREIYKKFGTPYVVSVRNVDLNIFFKYRFNLRKLGLRILLDATKIVFITKSAKFQLFKKYIPTRFHDELNAKSFIINNGIDDFWIRNKSDKPKSILEKKIRVIFTGDIDRNKNIMATILALDMLKKDGYNVDFEVIGKIINKKIYKKIIKYSFVKYYDYMCKEELIEHYKKSDIYIMPSFSETFGLSYVEAMSQGLPVIYTKDQGFDGIFPEGVVGYHVDASNYKDIASKVKKILNNYTVISKNCINNVVEFNWCNVSNKYENVYYEV